MRLEKRQFGLVIVFDKEESNLVGEVLGNIVADDGLITKGEYELRLSDGYGEHYALLKSATCAQFPAKYILLYPPGETIYKDEKLTNTELATKLLELLKNNVDTCFSFPRGPGWKLTYRKSNGEWETIFDSGDIE